MRRAAVIFQFHVVSVSLGVVVFCILVFWYFAFCTSRTKTVVKTNKILFGVW